MTYTAVCERAGKWWEITVPELPAGRVTQARRLSDVDATVKDLVSLMTGTAPEAIEVRKRVINDNGGSSAGIAGGLTALARAMRRAAQQPR